MKVRTILSLIVVMVVALPLSSWGQALFDINSIKTEPSRLFPIISETDIIGSPDDAIQISTIKKIKDRCLSRMPDRFTPSALQDYCSCSAASTQGTMTVGELRKLQNDENRKLGNPIFEKYVENVMTPCMEFPIEEIEYMFCISSQTIDWRIKLPVPFCKCRARGIKDYFKENGLQDMMVSWGQPKKYGDEDPTTLLWKNSNFLNAREATKESCVGNYLEPKYYK